MSLRFRNGVIVSSVSGPVASVLCLTDTCQNGSNTLSSSDSDDEPLLYRKKQPAFRQGRESAMVSQPMSRGGTSNSVNGSTSRTGKSGITKPKPNPRSKAKRKANVTSSHHSMMILANAAESVQPATSTQQDTQGTQGDNVDFSAGNGPPHPSSLYVPQHIDEATANSSMSLSGGLGNLHLEESQYNAGFPSPSPTRDPSLWDMAWEPTPMVMDSTLDGDTRSSNRVEEDDDAQELRRRTNELREDNMRLQIRLELAQEAQKKSELESELSVLNDRQNELQRSMLQGRFEATVRSLCSK